MKKWMLIFLWIIPVLFLMSAGKDLFICQIFSQVSGGGLGNLIEFWLGEQKEIYNVREVRALLRLQSVFYSILLAIASSVVAGIATKCVINRKQVSNKNEKNA